MVRAIDLNATEYLLDLPIYDAREFESVDSTFLHEHDDVSVDCYYVGITVLVPDYAKTFFNVIGFSFNVFENIPDEDGISEAILIYNNYNLVWICASADSFYVRFFI